MFAFFKNFAILTNKRNRDNHGFQQTNERDRDNHGFNKQME